MIYGNANGVDVYRFHVKEIKLSEIQIRANSLEKALSYLRCNLKDILDDSNSGIHETSYDISMDYSIREAHPYDIVERS